MRRDWACASARLVLGSSVAVSQIEPSSSSGRNSDPNRVPNASVTTNMATAASTTARGRAIAPSSHGRYQPTSRFITGFSPFSRSRRSHQKHSSGTTVRARMSAPISADVTE
ncbi:hypothetical protein D3C71_1244970 [compost metagenome]